ncbi:MAG: YceI family protein [Luteimonas sp.]|nr:YceI family protein [Luteimonas sp.]
MSCWRGIVVVLGAAMLAGAGQATSQPLMAVIDGDGSKAEFSLRTRWGQTLEGRFPSVSGEIERAGEQRKRVSVRMPTQAVEIVGNERFTRLTRGEGFFDSQHHPEVVFVSDAYPESLLRDGGKLAGELTIRGKTRREVFTLQPAACDRPGVDCDVVATGVVYRGDFDMDRWSFALSDRVRLSLRLRTRGSGG